jgi:transposase
MFSEVVMGRSPEVFVRPVSMAEGRRLQRIGRTAKDPVKLRRAIVVLMSARYVILDNFSPHHHPEITAWAAAHNVELVFLPTYASWLNWIVRHEVACE